MRLAKPLRTNYRKARNRALAARSWLVPYLRARMRPRGELRPLLAWLFTDWKCNLDCDYCYTYDNKLAGMELQIAKESIDWLHSLGCRVVAIMGGEPLVRKPFVLEVIEYGARRGMFMYVATNGRLLTPEFLRSAADAGLSALNIAMDCLEPRPGLPKAFSLVRKQYEWALAERDRSHFILFANVNVTPRNLDDIRPIAERVCADEVGIDFHACESPVVPIPASCSFDEALAIRAGQVDGIARTLELIDWIARLKASNRGSVLNSYAHLAAMKKFVENGGNPGDWGCRAGISSLAIRLDGTLASCFEGYHDRRRDWGRVGAPAFDLGALAEQKKTCSKGCLSTTNYNLANYMESVMHVVEWTRGHAF